MMRIGRWGMTALGLTLMTAACGATNPEAGEDATPIKRVPTPPNEFTPVELEATIDDLIAELNKHATQPMQMAIVLKDATGFWAPVVTAANRALGDLGVIGNVIGPISQSGDSDEDEALQNDQIAQVVADGAEGLGLAPFNDIQTDAVDAAVAEGVPVVTLDTDVASSKRALFVGTLDEAAGATAAQTLLAMLPPAPGTVILHGNEDPAWSNGMDRTQGAQGVLEAAGYDVLVRQSTWDDGGDVEDVDWMQAQIETADPPVVGMIGLFNISYRCAIAAEAAGKPDLPIVAFDFDPMTVDYMREGRIKATHTQRQYYQGYLVPYILYGIKNIGLDATRQILAPQMVDDIRVNTGLDVVPADKIDAYNDFLDAIRANQ
ncbi:substrate-binding domain-containing protein (plasmid) [Sorangium sp. So ce119]|uniref:sugar ABC transporter substrate-binding protein n=1 Tax=Sorangium sp. So ce119 TaxID=3133279 RepID=UPI003F5ECC04